jgi:hypothetical protein
MILSNTDKGSLVLQCLSSVEYHEMKLQDAISGNPILERPSQFPEKRNDFYKVLQENGFERAAKFYSLGPPTFINRIVSKFKRSIKKTLSKVGVL